MSYALLAVKAALTLAFVAAGISKLAGADMMIGIFDAVGVGQWFRYVTGVVEIAGAALLWMNGRQAYGAALLGATMAGATIAHLTVLGTSAVPAIVLGLLSAPVLWWHRDQVIGAAA